MILVWVLISPVPLIYDTLSIIRTLEAKTSYSEVLESSRSQDAFALARRRIRKKPAMPPAASNSAISIIPKPEP